MITNSGSVIKISMPTDPKFISVIRMTASSIANQIGFNIEEIEDIKIAVSEASTNVIKYTNVDTFELKFAEGKDFIEIEVRDDGQGLDPSQITLPNFDEDREDGGLGIYIMKALMDEVDIHSTKGEGTVIYMKKYMGKEV